TKQNYLMALSYLLRNVPKQVLIGDLPSLFPLLIHSLSLADSNLRASTIDTFYIISFDVPHIISEHISSLIPLLLSLAQMSDINTMIPGNHVTAPLGTNTPKWQFYLLHGPPLFAKFAMPLLVEKLASDSSNAKKDSMVALKACAPVYGLSAIVPHLENLWDYLKDEIINATNDSFELIALEAIQSIAETLSTDEIENLDHLQQFLKNVITECLENLKNSELKLAKPCGKILKYCAMTSDPACNIIISATLKNFIIQYRTSDLATRKKGILEILVEFIAAVRYLYGSIENAPNIKDQNFVMPLAPYKDDMLDVFSSALLGINEYNELRLCGLRGLHDMILLNNFLSDNEIGLILQYFNKIILDEQDQDIVSPALEYLGNIAHYKPKIVLDVTLPIFVSKLPNIGDVINKGSYTNYNKILDSISKISAEPILFEALVPEILAKLNNVLSPLSSTNCDYTEAILQALHTIFLKKLSLSHTDISRYVNIIIPHLLARCIEPTL
ncbi:19273_t:CDS:10, partial [Racocetra persica]